MENTNRRDFIKGAVVAAGVAAAGAVVAPKAFAAQSATDVTWDYETDIAIVGCGTGGVATAVAAVDEGAEVLIIEKHDWLGGQLRRCGGGIAAAGTQVQKKFGIEDDPEKFFEYWMAADEGLPNEELVRDWTMNSASVIDWVIDDLGGQPLDEWEICGDNDGLTYDEGPGLNVGTPWMYDEVGMEPVLRCHWFTKNADDPVLQDSAYLTYPTGGGTGLWKTFSDALDARGVQTLTETELASLVTDPATGEVVGISAMRGDAQINIKARKAVVLACGNWASNNDMFRNYTGADFVPGVGGGIGLDIIGENDGAGAKAAISVGADLVYPSLVGMNQDAPDGASFAVGGVKVDVNARVIDVYGNEIPRLYAVGLLGGGIIVKAYPMCGASVGRSLYFGRKAGIDAASLEPLA